jgi:ClpP class serine protease
MLFFDRSPVVPVLRLSGPIGMATPLRPGLALASLAGPLEKAFSLSKLPTVAVSINSPGGSPVQSHLIFSRIRQLAAEKEKRVYVFCEDVARQALLWRARAMIYADPSSIVGSIGVISRASASTGSSTASASSGASMLRARTRARSIPSSRSGARMWYG